MTQKGIKRQTTSKTLVTKREEYNNLNRSLVMSIMSMTITNSIKLK